MTYRLLLRCVPLAFVVACSKNVQVPKSPQSLSPRELQGATQAMAEAVRDVLRTQDEQLWAHWTEGKPLDLEAAYRGRESVYSADAVRTVRAARDRAVLRARSGDAEAAREVRALTHLLVHVTGEALARELRGPSDAVSALEASLTFGDGQREYPLGELDRLLTREKNAARRQAMYRNATPSFERLAEQVRRREEAALPALARLGYPDYETFGAELRQVELASLAAVAEGVLQATDAFYHQTLDGLARRELQTPRAGVRASDLPYLFRVQGADSVLAAAAAVKRAEEVARGLGVDVTRHKGLRWDTGESEGKKRAPLTLAVAVPSDVRVSLRPVAGLSGQAAVLHETGHALHFAFTEERRFELSKLGDPTVAEAFGSLLAGLTEEPAWLESAAGVSGEALTRYTAATRSAALYRLRHTAGALLYQFQLHRMGLADAPRARSLYRETLGRALGVSLNDDDVARYLQDAGEFYPAADAFRAEMLTGQLQSQLKARFGATWWTQAEAGKYLKGLWATGNALTPDELARRAGEPGLRPDGLLARLGVAPVPVSLHP